ncbi:MAG TPA: MBL fold metallo-hydrolase [Solirubrobacteraceae bacterium]|nr:MBL fold metallo-hydrolase [Solirubrobacteraceae bacterium]
MILKRCMADDWLSNTYLVGDGAGHAFFVDAGGPIEPLLQAAERHRIVPSHVLLTHHHHDHVAELPKILEAHPAIEVLIHPAEAHLVEGVTGTIQPGHPIHAGGLEVQTLHTPGHTKGMVAFVADGDVFTGDTLFKGSVGGVRAPEHTTYDDLRTSIMETLMGLDRSLQVRPGHTDPTTLAHEYEHNPFVRLWRGLDEEGDEPCTVFGEEATLVLLGPDYDGGHKAWIRWRDGRDDIVPGSVVQRTA